MYRLVQILLASLISFYTLNGCGNPFKIPTDTVRNYILHCTSWNELIISPTRPLNDNFIEFYFAEIEDQQVLKHIHKLLNKSACERKNFFDYNIQYSHQERMHINNLLNRGFEKGAHLIEFYSYCNVTRPFSGGLLPFLIHQRCYNLIKYAIQFLNPAYKHSSWTSDYIVLFEQYKNSTISSDDLYIFLKENVIKIFFHWCYEDF